ncbi:DinI-like family protein [Enterobacter soli]|nr:DinI-like family protein [Enterobacter soli]
MWLMKTLLTSGCTNQRGAGQVHQIFPDAEVKVKPMQANGLNSDASKGDREKLNRMLEEMFDESDMWLVND